MTKDTYTISCSCNLVYIGETGLTVKIRLSELKRCLRPGLLKHYAVVEHNQQIEHQILWHVFVVSRCLHSYKRKIRESRELSRYTGNFNRDIGYPLARIWNTAIQQHVIGKRSPYISKSGINLNSIWSLVSPPEQTLYNRGRNVEFLIADHDMVQIRKRLFF